jgi:hypothetical protein
MLYMYMKANIPKYFDTAAVWCSLRLEFEFSFGDLYALKSLAFHPLFFSIMVFI